MTVQLGTLLPGARFRCPWRDDKTAGVVVDVSESGVDVQLDNATAVVIHGIEVYQRRERARWSTDTRVEPLEYVFTGRVA